MNGPHGLHVITQCTMTRSARAHTGQGNVMEELQVQIVQEKMRKRLNVQAVVSKISIKIHKELNIKINA